jgi:hypothetical protein
MNRFIKMKSKKIPVHFDDPVQLMKSKKIKRERGRRG